MYLRCAHTRPPPVHFHERKGTALTHAITPATKQATTQPRSLQWRVIDIIVAAVLGVATAVIFRAWDFAAGPLSEPLDAVLPGFAAVTAGIWLLGGVLGGLIIRKPGAALFVEAFAAFMSWMLGSPWGIDTFYSGLVQGLGAEIIFAMFLYRRFGPLVAALAGALSAVAAWLLYLAIYGYADYGVEYNVIYLVCSILSGMVLAGILGWLLTKALAATGALDRLASGRDTKRV